MFNIERLTSFCLKIMEKNWSRFPLLGFKQAMQNRKLKEYLFLAVLTLLHL